MKEKEPPKLPEIKNTDDWVQLLLAAVELSLEKEKNKKVVEQFQK